MSMPFAGLRTQTNRAEGLHKMEALLWVPFREPTSISWSPSYRVHIMERPLHLKESIS